MKKQVKNKKNSIYLSRLDLVKEIAVCVLFAGILYLFFRSVLVLAAMPLFIFLYHKRYKRAMRKKYNETVCAQFKDALNAIAAALRAGYSAENAIAESRREMDIVYGKDAPISRELSLMENQIKLGITAEQAIEELAARTQISEIETFAAVFKTAKNSGGDMVRIIQETAEEISDKIETKKEIAVVLSSKKLEKNIMALMPPAMILYIEVTSGGMIAPLFGNIKGVVIMAASLAVYILAVLLSEKITDIEV